MRPTNYKIILLLISVIGIWSLIGYKIIMSLETPVSIGNYHQAKKIITEKESLPPLKLNYPDPFLVGKTSTLHTKPIKPQAVIARKKTENEKQVVTYVNWDKLTFLGRIVNANRHELFAVLKIDGVEFIVKEGNEVEGFFVNKIHKDSVLIDYHGQNKMLKKIK